MGSLVTFLLPLFSERPSEDESHRLWDNRRTSNAMVGVLRSLAETQTLRAPTLIKAPNNTGHNSELRV